MKKLVLILSGLLFAIAAWAQTNVRAWYAQGQVWVVWKTGIPLPETYAIYAKPAPFANTSDAVLIGRLFKEEYFPGALKAQVDVNATYRIPDGQGGIYQLSPDEGLFVATPHQAGALWIAVVPWGETEVTAGVNLTQQTVTFQYDPQTDPVECHLQKSWVSSPGFITLAFYMWADGRQNQWESRPDFPVMANFAKNGMPSMFLVSAPADLDTTQLLPETIWLHGGHCSAIPGIPSGDPIVNLKPEKGILVSHNDDVIGYLSNHYAGFEFSSKHIGWRKNYDPFRTDNVPTEVDTVVNYTQRRYIWIDQWLIRRYHVDPNRINLNGHSLGAKGAGALAKAYPNHFASVTIFNSGFLEDDPPSLVDIYFGPSAFNFPTNLINRDGKILGFAELSNLSDRNAIARDLPLIRVFHGKNDDDSGSKWDAQVVEQLYAADSIGWGAQLSWSQRGHGIDTGPAYNDHWFAGNAPDEQTVVDNVAYEENLRSDVSFPAFFHHHLDPRNNDPGDGTPGTGPNGVGDDWGTWGGYHRWDWDNIIDLPEKWAAEAWLESNAVFPNDNCPYDRLTADLAIRKPRQFKPATGENVHWEVIDGNTNEVLQSGNAVVKADSLVVIPQVDVYRESIRSVRIEVTPMDVATPPEPGSTVISDFKLAPNPSGREARMSVYVPEQTAAVIAAVSTTGLKAMFNYSLHPGKNEISLASFDHLPAGLYFLELTVPGDRHTVKWVKSD